MDIPKSFEPKAVEQKWYTFWEERKLFEPTFDPNKKPFCMVIPPPNVTGTLHMGHALNVTLQDIVARYKRMTGYDVLWVPGTDHAGIATQNVVERYILETEGKTRKEIGRERFIEKVWEWKEKHGNEIVNQLRRLGATCDWTRLRFTMDENFTRAVRKVFVKLYEEGLIYRANYLINWCPRCQTALSDLEVEHKETDGYLYYIKYPLKGKRGHIVVATTRPETMLGDTAVAVNPKDERYKSLVGEKVILPLVGREIPIIEDPYVDMEFGTGALKITPAHDFNDFEIGKKHNLPSVKVIDEEGKMTEEAGPYAGLDRFEARKRIVKDLEGEGYLVKVENYRHSVGHCYRCQTVVEPCLSLQWFVKTKPLAERAIDAVRTGAIKLIPKNWEKTYFDWMENIKDWCISRQIWWGHRIPVWYCEECGAVNVSEDDSLACCTSCGSKNLKPEEDVLDTWFSSALWPMGTLGWPDETAELERFYPTSLLVTGFDILFFWVARMIMMGLKFMNDVPFREVYLHALVRDEHGRKMSKSRGNVIDPLIMMEKYGTDAFRFTLAIMTVQGRDILLSESRIEGYKHFCNKLWNASRFCLMNIEPEAFKEEKPNSPSFMEKAILTKLHNTVTKVRESLESYRFNEAASSIYDFVWHEFCDWYVEIAKPVIYGSNTNKKDTMITLSLCLKESLKMLHPFMPYITEEIWHLIPGNEKSIMEESFPEPIEELNFPEVEEGFEFFKRLVSGIRNIRVELGIKPNLEVEVYYSTGNEKERKIIEENKSFIEKLSRAKFIKPVEDGKREKSAIKLIGETEVFVVLEGIMDWKAELRRLEKELKKVEGDLELISKKLHNYEFLQKAPKEIVEKESKRFEDLKEKREKLLQSISTVKRII